MLYKGDLFKSGFIHIIDEIIHEGIQKHNGEVKPKHMILSKCGKKFDINRCSPVNERPYDNEICSDCYDEYYSDRRT